MGPNRVALLLAEILNALFKCSPQPMLLLFVTVRLLLLFSGKFSGQQAENGKNTWGFPGIFGYYPHWTLEIVVGHCQAFLTVVQSA